MNIGDYYLDIKIWLGFLVDLPPTKKKENRQIS